MDRMFYRAELKAMNTASDGTFEGYGSIFGNVDSYSDIVLPGAFAASIVENGKPKMLWQHRSDMPIGVFTECREDSRGLYVKGQLALGVQAGAEAYELLKLGALDGMSIGYATEDYSMDEVQRVRKLKKVRLYEVSLVTFPANAAATVTGVKHRANRPHTIREFEASLRYAGFSKDEAIRLASAAKSAVPELWETAADNTELLKALQETAAKQEGLQSLLRGLA